MKVESDDELECEEFEFLWRRNFPVTLIY
jgi:hypothetical protein